MTDRTIRNWAIGVVLAALAGFAIWKFGVEDSSPSPSIQGPSTVYVTKIPGLVGVTNGNFNLQGFSDGGYSSMYWTDTFGATVPFAGDGVDQPFECPDVGTFTVSLTEVNRAGHRGKASQSITCITR